jgi:hypothetical protein
MFITAPGRYIGELYGIRDALQCYMVRSQLLYGFFDMMGFENAIGGLGVVS